MSTNNSFFLCMRREDGLYLGTMEMQVSIGGQVNL